MKTKEELNSIKEEVETLNKKLSELTEEELKHVVGGKLNIKLSDDELNARKVAARQMDPDNTDQLFDEWCWSDYWCVVSYYCTVLAVYNGSY